MKISYTLAYLALNALALNAQDNVEPDVTIFNTFQEQNKTGGLETIYDYSEATISDGNEFSLFPQNPPGTPEGGFYNIDISPDSMDAMKGTITWTLKDNLGAGHLVLPEGSFDRYYITFLNKSIASASITSSTNLNPKVSVPCYEEKNEIQDFFGSGLPFPPILGNNVVLLEVQPGGDMTELEQVIVVEYSLLDENVPDVSGSGSVSIWNTFEEVEGTGGQETIYSYSESTISDGVEFSLFPPNPPGTPEGGFYDIDISLDDMDASKGTITWTLKDNLGAGHLVVGVGSFDRYYVIFDQDVASASLVESASLNPKVSVPYYEEKNDILDLFGSGLPFPSVLDSKVILLEVRPGGDMTELEQVMRVEFTLFGDMVVAETDVEIIGEESADVGEVIDAVGEGIRDVDEEIDNSGEVEDDQDDSSASGISIGLLVVGISLLNCASFFLG